MATQNNDVISRALQPSVDFWKQLMIVKEGESVDVWIIKEKEGKSMEFVIVSPEYPFT